MRAESLLQAALDDRDTLPQMLLPCLLPLCDRLFQPSFVRSALGRSKVSIVSHLTLLVFDDPGVLPVECIDLLPKLIAFRVPELSLKTVIVLYLLQIDLLRAFHPGDHVAETVYLLQ